MKINDIFISLSSQKCKLHHLYSHVLFQFTTRMFINILIYDTSIYRFFKLYVKYFLVKCVPVFVALVSGDMCSLHFIHDYFKTTTFFFSPHQRTF